MQEPQRRVEQIDEVLAGDTGRILVAAFLEIQPRLDQLQIPVAELAPEEVVDAVGGFVKAVGRQRIVDIGNDAIEAGEDPAIFERCCREIRRPLDWPALPVAGRSPGSTRSTFMNMKRAAFQILLAKAR